MAYAGHHGHRRRARRGLPGRLSRIGWSSPRSGSPAPRRLHAVAALAERGSSPDAPSLPITSAAWLQRAAGRDPLQGAAPPGRAGARRSRLRVALADAARLSIKPLPTDAPDVSDRLFVTIAASDNTLSPAERLKTIYPRYADAAAVRRRRRAQPAGLPRRHALSGRGSDPRARCAGALPAPLHPPDRVDARHVPARAPHRQRRRHGALSARMAGRLARGRRRHRSADRGLPPDADAPG